MNLSTRTNQTLSIGSLISQVLMPLNVLNGNNLPPADGTIRNVTSQNSLTFEERDPVRSTERVPECSSNQTDRDWSASSGASTAPGTTNPFFQVEAA
ncbi:hypothetical protein BH09BAC5_BH09BAC5_14590 [soil metagenome]